MSNELVDLMLMHGRSEGLFSPPIVDIRNRYMNNDFKTSSWLPLYEIGRREWDTTPALNKIGGADDDSGIYQFLNNNNVEFYITDAELFNVGAFDGWGLTQRLFSGEFPPDVALLFANDQLHPEEDWGDYE